MKPSNITVTVNINGLEIEVSGKAYPGCPERGPSYDCGGEPAEPPELEVHSMFILDDDGGKFPVDFAALDDKTYQAIESEVFEKLDERIADSMSDKADAEYEAARERKFNP